MKKTLLTSVAALFLVTGTAHAQDEPEWPEGIELDCGKQLADDTIYVKHTHLLSDMSSHTITIISGQGRQLAQISQGAD